MIKILVIITDLFHFSLTDVAPTGAKSFYYTNALRSREFNGIMQKVYIFVINIIVQIEDCAGFK